MAKRPAATHLTTWSMNLHMNLQIVHHEFSFNYFLGSQTGVTFGNLTEPLGRKKHLASAISLFTGDVLR